MSSLRQNSSFTNRMQQSTAQSVTAQQFQTWSRDRDDFGRDADASKREREELEQGVRRIRELQKKVKEQSDIATNELGSLHRERQMLVATRARLQETLAAERGQLEECTSEIEQVCSDEREEKRAFHKAMGEFNRELGYLLHKGRDYRLQKMITVDTVSIIFEQHKLEFDNDENVSPESKADNDAALKELEQAVHVFPEKANLHLTAVAKREKDESTVKDFRSRVMTHAQDGSLPSQLLNQANLEELESKWAQNEEGGSGGGGDLAGDGANTMIPEAALTMTNPVHLQIFYDDDDTAHVPATQDEGEDNQSYAPEAALEPATEENPLESTELM